MRTALVGMGLGTPETMTAEGLQTVLRADLIVGAARLLEQLPEGCSQNRRAATKAEELFQLLQGGSWNFPCVVYSGDTGFYSGARTLLPLLERAGWEVEVLPGISSVQMLAARLCRPWQDWTLVSAHGVSCDAVGAVCGGRPVCFLTGGALGPAKLCAQLREAGLGALSVVVGENLSYPEERIQSGTAAELCEREFAPLSVLLAEAAPVKWEQRTQGIPDGEFLRGTVPMTKQEARAAILGKLGLRPGDIVYDVGAGTGSVSVEMALAARPGAVYAIEKKPEACGLIRDNREKFGAYALRLVEGSAPEALRELPAPDAVFVGGSGGRLEAILRAVTEKNPRVRICVSAVTVETLSEAVRVLGLLGKRLRVTQLSVSRSKEAGNLHMLLAENPVYLITGDCDE